MVMFTRRFRTALAATAVALLAAGCRPHHHHYDEGDDGHDDGWAYSYYDRYEPNDTEFLAYYLGGPNHLYQVYGAISEDGDEDWFSFWQDDGFGIDLFLSNLPDDYELQLYDDDGDLVASSSHPGTANESFFVYAPHSGRYYIRVQGWDTDHDPYRAYLLEVRLD